MIRSRTWPSAGVYLGYAIVIAVFGGPVALMVLSGFRHGADIPMRVFTIGNSLTLTNYRHVFELVPVGRYLLNSLLIATFSTGIGLVLGVPAAYGLVRSGRRGLGLVPLGVRMMPGVLFLLPLASVSVRLGLTSSAASIWVLIAAHTIVTLPLCVWLVMPAVSTVPVEVEEAAMLDGASRSIRFVRVVAPLISPAIAVAGLSSFLYSWNYFLFGLALANEDSMPIAVAAFRFVGEGQNDYGGLMAMATLIAAPAFALVLMAQKWMIRGVVDGGV